MKVLNLYAGVGGNRYHWPSDWEVTAVEFDPKIAEIYKHHNPQDEVVIGDAHDFLLENYDNGFEFIWSSPPCQSHSKMAICGHNRKRRRYPDMKLYEEIVLLKTNHNKFSFDFAVENVVPYYGVLVPAHKIGRHLFWSNLDLTGITDVKRPKGFITDFSTIAGSKELQDWLGIHWDQTVYYQQNHCASQIWRNCVHPEIGKAIASRVLGKAKQKNLTIYKGD